MEEEDKEKQRDDIDSRDSHREISGFFDGLVVRTAGGAYLVELKENRINACHHLENHHARCSYEWLVPTKARGEVGRSLALIELLVTDERAYEWLKGVRLIQISQSKAHITEVVRH